MLVILILAGVLALALLAGWAIDVPRSRPEIDGALVRIPVKRPKPRRLH